MTRMNDCIVKVCMEMILGVGTGIMYLSGRIHIWSKTKPNKLNISLRQNMRFRLHNLSIC